MTEGRRILGWAAAAVLLAVGSLAPSAHAASRLPALCNGSWKYPKPIPHSDRYTLNDIAAVGQKDVWIVGTASNAVLTLHWNGYSWRRVGAPTPGRGEHARLTGVAAGPHGDVWAVGRASNGPDARVFVLHWNGMEWTLAHVPSMAAGVAGPKLVVLAHQEVWVVSGHSMMHRTRSGWTRVGVPAPDPAEYWSLTAISAESPSSIWASGWVSNGTSHVYSGGLLEHWDGRRWELRLGHRLPERPLGVDAVSSDVMVVGADFTTLWGHDGVWKERRAPQPTIGDGYDETLSDVVWTSGTKAFAVGDAEWTGIQDVDRAFIDRWYGHRWHHAWLSPSYRSHLTAVDTGGGMTWAIGATEHGVILVRRC
jgi:hypothetical protein